MSRCLRLKLRRDLWQSRAQVLAASLVVACSVAAAVMAGNVRRSLDGMLEDLYRQTDFAELFAATPWLPATLLPALVELPGIRVLEARIVVLASLEVPGLAEPAVGRVASLPDHREAALNRIVLRAGRSVMPGARTEVVLSEPFAAAHGLGPGSRLRARIGEAQQTLIVTGVALSPEAVFAVGPGQIVPDDRRFGHLWMSHAALAELVDSEGHFNDLALQLETPELLADVVRAVEAQLEPYGGGLLQPRAGHPSHAFVQGQLDQLAGLALVLPLLFLLLACVLLFGMLRHRVLAEQPQIGTLRALGISGAAVRWHYLQHALFVALLGSALGAGLGTLIGIRLGELYGEFFRFPHLHHAIDGQVMAGAVAAVIAATLASATLVLRRPLQLPPAEVRRAAHALQGFARLHWLAGSGRVRMLARQLLRHGPRTLVTAATATLAVALIVATLFSFDALDRMILVTAASERQDLLLLAPFPVPPAALQELQELPGIERAEGFRSVPAELHAHGRVQAVALVGLPPQGRLRQLLAPDLNPLPVPADGLAVTRALAQRLGLEPGEFVQLRLPGRPAPRKVALAGVVEQYFGIEAAVALPTLHAWLGETPRYDGVRVALAPGSATDFYRALRTAPVPLMVIDKASALEAFRSTMTATLRILVSFFVVLAVLATLGVLYTNARIVLAERRRETAILRAMGLSRLAVNGLLLAEISLPALLAVALGPPLGRVFGWLIVTSLESPLFRVPLVVAARTDALAVTIALTATLVAAVLAARRALRGPIAEAVAGAD
jgi:putative ABC transport system permease protein